MKISTTKNCKRVDHKGFRPNDQQETMQQNITEDCINLAPIRHLTGYLTGPCD